MKKLAFISDIHFDEQFPVDHGINAKENWDKIISDLRSRNIKDVIFGGDIGAKTGHTYFFATLTNFSVHLILGNHDIFNQVSKFYNPYKSIDELYYYFEDKYNKYIFLDSSSDKLSDKQLFWLKSNLTIEKSLIIFIHHPILRVSTRIDELYPLKNRDEIKAILENSRQPVTIFCGHYHMNDTQIENNIRQIITPASSYQIEKESNEISIINSEFGYRIIEIDKDSIKTELVNFKSNKRNTTLNI